MNYFLRNARALSQMLNSLLPGGSSDITLSGRSYIEAQQGKKWAIISESIIDRMFFWQHRHCKMSWEVDVFIARQIVSIDEQKHTLFYWYNK